METDRDDMMKPLRRITLSLGVASAIYVASYATFSARGSYEQTPREFIGQVRWSPAIESRAAETLFRPLIEFDRRFAHPSNHRC